VGILGQRTLAGRSYSSTLIAAVGGLLAECGTTLQDLRAIVAVYGPGSFTGVRVGLGAVKGLAEPAQIPVAPVSRLAVLARKAGVQAAALDAHRSEVFLRLDGEHTIPREMLVGAEELNAIETRPERIATCDDGAAALIGAAWPRVQVVRVNEPSAADAIKFAMKELVTEEFVDLALLDGHYLRRSDAEIFGRSADQRLKPESIQAVVIREMKEADIEQVMEIAASEREAPHWARSAYLVAVSQVGRRRIALVAENAKGAIAGFAIVSITPPEAELETIVTAVEFQRQGFARSLFNSVVCELRRGDVGKISLEVRESNRRARTFYASQGFIESGHRPRYYADPTEDAVLMHLDLSHGNERQRPDSRQPTM